MFKSVAKKILADYVDDRSLVYFTHFAVHRRLPDLRRQRSFSDRMAFRKLYPQPEFERLTDKIHARDYVRARVGERYLVPLYGVTSNIDNYRLEDLPSSFAM